MALRATHRMMDILHERFEGMVISRGGDMNWPPRSCDLTPLDFFLWGYLKSQVYTNKPQTIDALKVNVTNAIEQIQPESHRKLDRPNTCHQAKPRRTFEQRYIPLNAIKFLFFQIKKKLSGYLTHNLFYLHLKIEHPY